MSDDLGKRIKQITDILGQENLPDNIKGLLNVLASSGPREEASEKPVEAPVVKEEKVNRSEIEENIEMVRKVTKIMDRLKNNSDPRINLLTAVRPFLSNRRQQKINDCIKILQLTSITRLLDENDKSDF